MGPYQFREEDAERFALSTGIKFFRTGRELTFTECPYCSGRTRDKKTFAINLDTGKFNCFRASCGAKGNMITLAKDFNFSLGQNADEYYKPARRYRSWKRPEAPIEPKGAELIYLGDRGISEQTVRKYQITSRDADIVVFPHIDENGNIQTIKYRNAHPQEGQSKEFFERNCRPILFGMYQCNLENKTLIVTEGQIDALSVAEAGIENAVSVPGGVNSFTWIPYCWNWVNQFNRIIVFGDHEKGRVTLYKEFLSRWKEKVWCVREEDYLDCKDANDILRKYGADQIRRCVENAQQPPVTQIIEIADVPDVDVNKLPKLKTGLHQVDDLLKGGLPMGQLVLITGKAGDGKSTLANQIALNAINEYYKVFLYSGELPNFMLKAWLTFQAAGPDHVRNVAEEDKPPQYEVDPEAREAISNWLRGKAWMYDNKIATDDEEEQQKLLDLIEQAVERFGAEVILLDNLMTAMDLQPDNGAQDKYDRQSLFIKKLAKLALNRNVLIILVAHKRKSNGFAGINDSVSGSADIVNLASIVISYERPNIKPISTTVEELDTSASIEDQKRQKERIKKQQVKLAKEIAENEELERKRYLKITKNRIFGDINEKGWLLKFDESSKRIYMSDGERKKQMGWLELAGKPMRADGLIDADPEIELPWEGETDGNV